MKKTVRILAAVFAVLMLLSSCSETVKDETPAVMTLGDKKITAAMYGFWASCYKGDYLASYDDVANNDETWNREISEGLTVGDYLDNVTLEKIKYNLVSMMLFDKYGLELSSEEKSNIKDYVSDIMLDKVGEDEEMFNAYLETFGVHKDMLENIFIEEAKVTKVYEYLYSKGGKNALTDADYEEFYQKNYVHFQMIYINNAYQYAVDENGLHYTDDEGYYVTEPLDADVKAEKDAAVADAEKALAEGKDFEEVYEEYSEMKSYPNGYYYSPNGDYGDEIFYDLTRLTKDLKVGEVAKLEADTGTCIILRLENDEGAWKEKTNSDFFGSFKDDAGDEAYRRFMEENYDGMWIDENAIKAYSVRNVIPAYFY